MPYTIECAVTPDLHLVEGNGIARLGGNAVHRKKEHKRDIKTHGKNFVKGGAVKIPVVSKSGIVIFKNGKKGERWKTGGYAHWSALPGDCDFHRFFR